MKLTYPAVFYKDEKSGAYAVEVPDLPGCATGGNTYGDVSTEARVMLSR
ncbi:MAG: type II toxin-antitoxin system HicB family antitoxin [Clostridiales bacterium]|nr:type II toxin-antitoxin system HicB family antitoxin [Clostridiales bacterium]